MVAFLPMYDFLHSENKTLSLHQKVCVTAERKDRRQAEGKTRKETRKRRVTPRLETSRRVQTEANLRRSH